ncbi:MAG: hypothetical protein QXK44_02875 [Archaeoglobaceae archaeon]
MEAKYLMKKGDEIVKHGEINEKLFDELTKAGVKRAIFLGEEVLYFESRKNKTILVSVEKRIAGFAKLFARKLLEEKKIDLKSVEEVFEFAEKVEKATLDELAKLR